MAARAHTHTFAVAVRPFPIYLAEIKFKDIFAPLYCGSEDVALVFMY